MFRNAGLTLTSKMLSTALYTFSCTARMPTSQHMARPKGLKPQRKTIWLNNLPWLRQVCPCVQMMITHHYCDRCADSDSQLKLLYMRHNEILQHKRYYLLTIQSIPRIISDKRLFKLPEKQPSLKRSPLINNYPKAAGNYDVSIIKEKTFYGSELSWNWFFIRLLLKVKILTV